MEDFNNKWSRISLFLEKPCGDVFLDFKIYQTILTL